MTIHNRYLSSGIHRLFNGLFGAVIAAGIGTAGVSFLSPENPLQVPSAWLLLLSPLVGVALMLLNPNRFSLVRGLAGDAGYDELNGHQ
jgi:hypothetical protein